MGYVAHHAVIVTGWNPEGPWHDDIAALRSTMPESHRHLLVGPVRGAINGDVSYALLPDASKEGWRDSEIGDEFRASLIAIARRRGLNFVEVRFGGDEPDLAAVVSHNGYDDDEAVAAPDTEGRGRA